MYPTAYGFMQPDVYKNQPDVFKYAIHGSYGLCSATIFCTCLIVFPRVFWSISFRKFKRKRTHMEKHIHVTWKPKMIRTKKRPDGFDMFWLDCIGDCSKSIIITSMKKKTEWRYTVPETNIAPENMPSPKEISCFNHQFNRGKLLVSEGYTLPKFKINTRK